MDSFDEHQSLDEGWVATTVYGSSHYPEGWMQIERYDVADKFANDYDALAFVADKAARGSGYHCNALHMIDDNNIEMVRTNRE